MLDRLKNEEKLNTEVKDFLRTVMKYSDKQMEQIDNNLSTEKLGRRYWVFDHAVKRYVRP
ncbi:hypothetical protein AWA2045_31300 (plasmid) [Lactiplantibacillus plantarum]|nr:phage tail tube assembly chaperone [Lactiplantibacillus plantarum]BEI54999.1 hypothetical protein AWA2045_31300 [Lactiplantibacillus plantarum]